MDYKAFYQKYLKFTVTRCIAGAILSLLSGILMMTLGVILDIGFVILTGFGLIFLFMILLMYSGIKASILSPKKTATIIDLFWAPLLKRIRPMESVTIKTWPKEENVPSLPLVDIIAPNPTHRVVLYTFSIDQVEGFALNYYAVRTTGRASASYENFRGLYLKIPVTPSIRLSIRKDPFGFIKKLSKYEEADGSKKYQIEPATSQVASTLIKQLEAFSFRHLDLEVGHGVLEVALPLWNLVPRVTKDAETSKELATAHLERLMDLVQWMKSTQEFLENQLENAL